MNLTPEQQHQYIELLKHQVSGQKLTQKEAQRLYDFTYDLSQHLPTEYSIETKNSY